MKSPNPNYKRPTIPVELLLNTEALNRKSQHPDMQVLQDWCLEKLKRPPDWDSPTPTNATEHNLRRWITWHPCQTIKPTHPTNNPSQHMFLVHLFTGAAWGHLVSFELATDYVEVWPDELAMGIPINECYRKLCLLQKWLPEPPSLFPTKTGSLYLL